jgi:hypothetical protein
MERACYPDEQFAMVLYVIVQYCNAMQWIRSQQWELGTVEISHSVQCRRQSLPVSIYLTSWRITKCTMDGRTMLVADFPVHARTFLLQQFGLELILTLLYWMAEFYHQRSLFSSDFVSIRLRHLCASSLSPFLAFFRLPYVVCKPFLSTQELHSFTLSESLLVTCLPISRGARTMVSSLRCCDIRSPSAVGPAMIPGTSRASGQLYDHAIMPV